MPFPASAILEIIVNGKASGQDIVNVFHYRKVIPGGGDIADTAFPDWAAAFATNWRTQVCVYLSNTYSVARYRLRTLQGVEAVPVPPPPKRIEIGTTYDLVGLPADSGALGGEVLPTFCAIGVRKITDRSGRSFRGGYRIGPFPEAETLSNFLQNAYLGTVQAGQSEFVVDPIDADFGESLEMCVFARTLVLAEAVGFTNLRTHTAKVVGAEVNPWVTSQVSRKASAFSPT